MNDKITKGYYVLETELAVLFALQKIENLYGIQLECAESMTKEQLYRTVFNLLKKGFVAQQDKTGACLVTEDMKHWLVTIGRAEHFWVYADRDELIPESYFYNWNNEVVWIQDGSINGSQLCIHEINKREMLELFTQWGVPMLDETNCAVEEDFLQEIGVYYGQSKEQLLQQSEIKAVVQEFNVKSHSKEQQILKLQRGLDQYIICSNAERSWGTPVKEGGEDEA